jgi:transcriptional regulator with XRE-family HTH domain
MVTARRSPTVRRRRLGFELRRLREQAGFTIQQVAARLECSDSKISRIETGQVSATPRDVRDILELFGVAGAQRDELVQIAREARLKGWWHTYDDRVIRALIGFEAAAATIRTYHSLLVPGLLQTVDYARAVTHAVRPDLSASEVERRVEVRTARQIHLPQEDPPSLSVVLDEAALRRPVGGSAVMSQQLRHLVEVAGLPNVRLQVLPFSAGVHAGMDGSFTIIGFPEPEDPEVVYLENATSDLYLEEPDDVRRYSVLFERISAAAMEPDASGVLLSDLVKELQDLGNHSEQS